MSANVFDSIPLFWVFMSLLGLILISGDFGFVLGRRTRTRYSDSASIRTGSVVTASLALLGFMSALTFSSVVENMEERKQLVLEEANAIGTAYLRADLLDSQDREQIKKQLYEYVALRIKIAQTYENVRIPEALLASETIQDQLWETAVESAGRNPTPVMSLVLQSINDVIDLHQMRIAVNYYHRMPNILWISLLGLTIIAMVIGGYHSGLTGGKRSVTATLSFALSFSLVLFLTVALDRPGNQVSTVTQDALIDVKHLIEGALK